MPKQLIAKRTVRKASKVLTAMDKKLDRILAVAKVAKNHKKVEAELDKMAIDLQKLYAGVKSKVAELEALPQLDKGTADLLEDTAILATKVDLLKSAIAKCKKAEEDEEEDDQTPVTVDDVLQDLGVEDGDAEGEDDNIGSEEDNNEDLDNDGVADVDEPHGELPEDFEGDHEDAMNLMGEEDDGDDDVLLDEDEDNDEEEAQTPVTASKKVKAKRKPAVAKRVVRKTMPETGVSGLFDFIGGGK